MDSKLLLGLERVVLKNRKLGSHILHITNPKHIFPVVFLNTFFL